MRMFARAYEASSDASEVLAVKAVERVEEISSWVGETIDVEVDFATIVADVVIGEAVCGMLQVSCARKGENVPTR
jgi:hypothetical protein